MVEDIITTGLLREDVGAVHRGERRRAGPPISTIRRQVDRRERGVVLHIRLPARRVLLETRFAAVVGLRACRRGLTRTRTGGLMTALRLGVNVDHVAHVDRLRGAPRLLRAALIEIEAVVYGLRRTARGPPADRRGHAPPQGPRSGKPLNSTWRDLSPLCSTSRSTTSSARLLPRAGRSTETTTEGLGMRSGTPRPSCRRQLTRRHRRQRRSNLAGGVKASAELVSCSARYGGHARACGEAAKAIIGRLAAARRPWRARRRRASRRPRPRACTPGASSPPCRRSSNSTQAIRRPAIFVGSPRNREGQRAWR